MIFLGKVAFKPTRVCFHDVFVGVLILRSGGRFADGAKVAEVPKDRRISFSKSVGFAWKYMLW